jgi:Bcr/CflA subfamily drug resistance transporter
MFILFRFFQAYGASVGSVIGQAMARDSYRGWELSYIYASVAMIMSFVPTIGSALGGYIVEYTSWQVVFRFLSVLAILMFAIYSRFLPETNTNIGTSSSIGFLSVLSTAIRDKILLSYAAIIGLFNGIIFGFYIQAPFIFIERLHIQPSYYGQLFLLLSVATLSGSLYVRYMLKKMSSAQKIRKIGFMFSGAGCILLVLLTSIIDRDADVYTMSLIIFLPMMLHLFGHSLIIPMILRDSLEDYREVTGTAGSILGSLYYGITAFICFIISIIHNHYINNFSYLFITLLFVAFILHCGTVKNQIPSKKLST